MSFPRYPKYKDSGVEWLGEVPEHWEVSRLGFESWVRARLGWKGLKAEEYVDDGYAFLSTPNIKNHDIDFENVNFITQERYEESPEIRLNEGDVLLAKDGSTLGTVNVVRKLPRPTTVNSSIAVITPHERLMAVYLYYLFASSFMDQTIQRTKGGMGVPHLFQEDLNKFYMPLPSRQEQDRIGEFLDRETEKIDELVAEQRRLMELLKEKRQAVISHAVTKGLNPRAPMEPSNIEWLGDVPEHWRSGSLKYFVRPKGDAIKTGPFGSQLTAPEMQSGTIKVYNQRNVIDRDFASGDNFITDEKFSELAGFETFPGDLLITTRGTIGRAAILPQNAERGILHPCLLRIQPDGNQLRTEFLMMLIQDSDLLKNQLSYLSNATTIEVIYSNTMASVTVPVPPLTEQDAIIRFLTEQTTKLDALAAEAQKAIDLLQERRTALISAAVTGQIDVRKLAAA